ncbi:fungal-specific transcription factor domain-containing protein [Dactylonectria macrodidyma]|uniref:Fungal-specific transcription factor domain-containing protein n=1 Tax=Dactylonectria macrodidyma TaxID=307937 RepID=A0A9P9JE18_9HYPO|nr:fungal-specific transcription factor domain-containing protein [Dactylonectria macrodidyma]
MSIDGPRDKDAPAAVQGLQRRRLLPVSRLESLSIESALSIIDGAAAHSIPKSCGPFSVFCLESTDEAPQLPPLDGENVATCSPNAFRDGGEGVDDTQHTLPEDQSLLGLQHQFVNDASDQNFLENITTNINPSSQQTGSISSTTVSITIGPLSGQNQAADVADAPDAPDGFNTALINQQTPLGMQPTASMTPSNGGSPEAFFLRADVKQLLRNYVQNVLPIFSPLDIPTSPWKDFHLPRALQCATELEIMDDVPVSRRALLHAILTISAYNLRNVHSSENESRRWGHVASHYKCEALKLLENCVGDSSTEVADHVYNELLAAMLCMVTIDVISGDTSTSEIHLQATETLIRGHLVKRRHEISDTTKGLHVIFLYLRTMQEATDLLCAQPNHSPTSTTRSPALSAAADDEGPKDVAELMILRETRPDFGCGSLEMTYGVPESLFLLLRKATRILGNSEFELDTDGNTPNPSMKLAVQKLEDEILEWPVEEAVARLETAPVSEGNRLVMQHYTRAYHQAIIIFYSRKAQNLHQRRFQPYVHEVIYHLEEIENAKQRHNLRTGHMPWPAFMAGSEAMGKALQGRFLQWFNTISEEGIWTSNFCKDVLINIWAQSSTPAVFSALRGVHLILT